MQSSHIEGESGSPSRPGAVLRCSRGQPPSPAVTYPPPVTTTEPRDLVTAQARALGREIATLPDTADPAALSALRRRHPEASPALIAALATQVRLERRGQDRLGPWAADMILEEEALQQATRRDVARYRAARLAGKLSAEIPVADLTVADIGCGLGVDARALAETGLGVIAIERDPWRASAAEINLAAYSSHVRVLRDDALTLNTSLLDTCHAAYVDPARRAPGGPRRIDGGRVRATHDPSQWSPPWPWVVTLSERMPVVAKVAPGFDPRLAPSGADVEWIDHDGETVEAAVWLGALGRGMRRATSVMADEAESLEAPASETGRGGPVTAEAGLLLLEPSPGVVRAGLLADLAEHFGARRLDGGGWLTADTAPESLLSRPWRIIEEIPCGARDLRAWLRGRGSVTWKTVDAHVAASEWDRRVGHQPAAGSPVTIVITGQGRAFAVERA